MVAQKAGLSNPYNMSSGLMVNPYATPNTGLASIETPDLDSIVEDYSLDAEPLGPRVMFNPTQGKMFVNGALYDVVDYQSAIDAEKSGVLRQPTAVRPEGDGWQDVSAESYNRYMRNITDPSTGNLMARNFEIGGDNLKLLFGRAAQFLGAEEFGQGLVDNAVKELYYNQPFQREFTSIKGVTGDYENHGAIDWFVANFAQQGPNLIESVVAALVGAGAGAIAGGGANPFTAVGGGVLALLGKETFKQSLLAASKKYMKGEALNAMEKKLLREAAGITGAARVINPNAFYVGRSGQVMTGKAFQRQMLDEGRDKLTDNVRRTLAGGRTQAMTGGAFGGSVVSSYLMGIGDIYGEMRDTGTGGRFQAALGAFPYAAMETIPEFFLAGRILGKSFPRKGLGESTKSVGEWATSGGKTKRFGKGFAVGGLLEGLTELGQESLILAQTGQLGDKETIKRLVNSFAAGFAIGGPLGGTANLFKTDSAIDVLKDESLEGEVLPPESPSTPPQLPPPDSTSTPQIGVVPPWTGGEPDYEGTRRMPSPPQDIPAGDASLRRPSIDELDPNQVDPNQVDPIDSNQRDSLPPEIKAAVDETIGYNLSRLDQDLDMLDQETSYLKEDLDEIKEVSPKQKKDFAKFINKTFADIQNMNPTDITPMDFENAERRIKDEYNRIVTGLEDKVTKKDVTTDADNELKRIIAKQNFIDNILPKIVAGTISYEDLSSDQKFLLQDADVKKRLEELETKAKEPTTEEPKAEEVTTEEPKAEEPTTEEVTSETAELEKLKQEIKDLEQKQLEVLNRYPRGELASDELFGSMLSEIEELRNQIGVLTRQLTDLGSATRPKEETTTETDGRSLDEDVVFSPRGENIEQDKYTSLYSKLFNDDSSAIRVKIESYRNRLKQFIKDSDAINPTTILNYVELKELNGQPILPFKEVIDANGLLLPEQEIIEKTLDFINALDASFNVFYEEIRVTELDDFNNRSAREQEARDKKTKVDHILSDNLQIYFLQAVALGDITSKGSTHDDKENPRFTALDVVANIEKILTTRRMQDDYAKEIELSMKPRRIPRGATINTGEFGVDETQQDLVDEVDRDDTTREPTPRELEDAGQKSFIEREIAETKPRVVTLQIRDKEGVRSVNVKVPSRLAKLPHYSRFFYGPPTDKIKESDLGIVPYKLGKKEDRLKQAVDVPSNQLSWLNKKGEPNFTGFTKRFEDVKKAMVQAGFTPPFIDIYQAKFDSIQLGDSTLSTDNRLEEMLTFLAEVERLPAMVNTAVSEMTNWISGWDAIGVTKGWRQLKDRTYSYTLLNEEDIDAFQKQSPTAVVLYKQAGVSGQDGRRDAQRETAGTYRDPLRIREKEEGSGVGSQAKGKKALREDIRKQTTEPSSQVVAFDPDINESDVYNDLRPKGTPEFDKITEQMQGAWKEIYIRGKASQSIARALYDNGVGDIESKLTKIERDQLELDTLIGTFSDYKKSGDFKYAAEGKSVADLIVEIALSPTALVDAKIAKQAQAYIDAGMLYESTKFTRDQQRAIKTAFLNHINTGSGKLDGVVNKEVRWWYKFAVRNDLLTSIDKRSFGDMPNEYTTAQEGKYKAIVEAIKGISPDKFEENKPRLRKDFMEVWQTVLARGENVDWVAWEDAFSALNEIEQGQRDEFKAEVQDWIATRSSEVLESSLFAYKPVEYGRTIPNIKIFSDQAGDSSSTTEIQRLENLYENSNKDYITSWGTRLSDYFDDNGKLKLRREATSERQRAKDSTREILVPDVTPTDGDLLRLAEERRKLKEEGKERELSERESRRLDNLDNWLEDMDAKSTEGRTFRIKDGKPTEPIPEGKIKIMVNQFLKKLKIKPNIYIYKDVNDLRIRNEALFERARAGMPQRLDEDGNVVSDFETLNIVGYSIGADIIIFSDFIKDPQQLKTLLAHETLGHFGFRAFLPKARLDPILRQIYRDDPHIRKLADTYMSSFGMDKLEAVEEALADQAAVLDTSVWRRLMDLVLRAFDALGLPVKGDLARYLLHQSRRNLRTGNRGVFSASQLVTNLNNLESYKGEGRASLENDRADLATGMLKAWSFNKRAGNFNSFDGAKEKLDRLFKTRSTKDVKNLIDTAFRKVQTLDFLATKSPGLSKIFQIFQRQSAKTREYASIYENLTKFTNTPSWFGWGNGPTQEEIDIAGRMLVFSSQLKRNTYGEDAINNEPSLRDKDSEYIGTDTSAREQMADKGLLTIEEFREGFTVSDISGGTLSTDTAWTADQITDRVYRIYLEHRRAINQSAVDVFEANLLSVAGHRGKIVDTFMNIIRKLPNGPKTQQEKEKAVTVIKRIAEEFELLFNEHTGTEDSKKEAKAKADKFLSEINRAMHKSRKVQDWLSADPKEDASLFQGDRYQDIIDYLTRLNSFGIGEQTAYRITNAIQHLYTLEIGMEGIESRTKQTLLQGYVPIVREGDWQVRVQAYDTNGNAVKLDETYQAFMPYFREDKEGDAKLIKEELETEFTLDENGKPIINTVLDENKQKVEVVFRPIYERTDPTQQVTGTMDLSEFMSIASRLDVDLTPTTRERVIKALSKQESNVRKRALQRAFAAGWDQNVIRNNSKFLERQAHVAGKTQFSYLIQDIMLDEDLWTGDPSLLKELEAATKVGTPEQRYQAFKEYAKYAHQYSYSAGVGNPTKAKVFDPKTGEFKVGKDGNVVEKENKGEGKVFRTEANKLLHWYSNADNIMDSTEDILSGETGSKLKLTAVLFQLGGSFATAFINAGSLVTNTFNYLAFENSATGFGGGFGMGNSMGAITRALYNLGNPKLANFEYLNGEQDPESGSVKPNTGLVNNQELRDTHGISQDEAVALRDATGAGVLQAAQSNALLGTARGGIHRATTAGLVKGWMYMFNYTEQVNRRTTFLAAYRLQREKLLALLPNEFNNFSAEEQAEAIKQIHTDSAAFATTAVNTSQGEYAMYNRPEMARGNWLQYIFMYKQYPIITLEMMKNMNKTGKLSMLGMFFLMSGIKGLPFADDLMDIIDTIAQKLGIRMKAVEEEAMRMADAIIPGSSPYAMRGFLDPFFGATVSTRLGFGDLVPLTGAFKAHSNMGEKWREASNFFGPVYSGVEGIVKTSSQLARYGTEKVGLRDDTTKFVDILRDSPVSALRALADGATYLDDGKITRTNGTVLDNDANVLEIAGRMLGFYPYSATVQNDIIRLSKQTTAYVQAQKSHYKVAMLKAKLDKDRDEQRRILQFVREWNKETRGTEFYFKDFMGSVNKAFKTARLNAVQRYLKSAPLLQRPPAMDLVDMLSVPAT